MIDGIHIISERYDSFILDVWGVLHNGIKPFPGTINCLQNLKDRGKKILLLSNTPHLSFIVSQELTSIGITDDLYDHILTAGDSAYEEIKSYKGKSCWYASSGSGSNHSSSLTGGLDLDIKYKPQNVDFMINDLYDLSAREKQTVMPLLEEACKNNLVMICANPDIIVGVGDEIKECPGAYALIYEQMGGIVSYHGKPHKPIYDRAWHLLGKPDKNRVVAVGDSLHTDIQGANNFGIDSILNLDGIHHDEAYTENEPDIDKIKNILASQGHKPTAVLNSFRW